MDGFPVSVPKGLIKTDQNSVIIILPTINIPNIFHGIDTIVILFGENAPALLKPRF